MPDPTPQPTVKLDPSKPILQPATYGADAGSKFTSSEILWWKNGVWGDCGYAIPNDGGKPTTSNEAIFRIHKFIGSQMFSLMHRPDVKFSRPFNAEWLFDLNKMLVLGIKRMSDSSIGWTDKRDGDAMHNINTPMAFLYYPVPFFGTRVRQQDALTWCGQTLKLLGEIQQHSDNVYDDNVTDFFCSMVQEALLRIQKDMALKYLGYKREEVDAAGFTVDPAKFAKGTYDPSSLFVDSELTEELPPQQWWPSTNDLTPISGVAAPVANVFAARWPISDGFYGDGGAVETAFPGGGVALVAKPGARPTV
jgi:hypothetical protein